MARGLTLSPSERAALQCQAAICAGSSGNARRAQLILLLASGLTWIDIRRRLNCSDSYIARWRARFAAEGIAGLYARHAGRARYKVNDTLEARVLKHTTEHSPADGSRYWSSRKLAAELGGVISHLTVARIWARHGIKPARQATIRKDDAPDFDFNAASADVVGLYLMQPQHAMVLCLITISAEAPGGPTEPQAYRRAGIRALLVAIQARRLNASIKAGTRHTSAGLAAYLADIVAHRPNGSTTHVMADNPSVRAARAMTALESTHPGLRMHFTTTYAAWLHQVERCLTAIERDMRSRDLDPPIPDLKETLIRAMRRLGSRQRGFKWKFAPPAIHLP